MKKFLYSLCIISLICGANITDAAPPKKPKNVVQKYNIKPGDVMVVEVVLNGQIELILVRVRDDLIMYHIKNGVDHPFPVADLDVFRWAFYIKN